MRLIKKTILTISFLILAGFICRGWIYRSVIQYHSIGTRSSYTVTNKKLFDYLNTNDTISTGNVKNMVSLCLSLTSRQLRFTTGKNKTDPNDLISSGTANCIGYAAFFTASCNYLLQKHNLSSTWVVQHRVGKLYLGKTDIHSFFKTAFFKDHDFVTIENKNSGEILAVDPTVHDYLWIEDIGYGQ